MFRYAGVGAFGWDGKIYYVEFIEEKKKERKETMKKHFSEKEKLPRKFDGDTHAWLTVVDRSSSTAEQLFLVFIGAVSFVDK